MIDNFKELTKLDKMIYKNNIKLCNPCPGYDKCQQTIKGVYPVIRQRSITKDWVLIDASCGRQRGKCHSYLDIKLYDDIYKNSNRADLVDYLLKGKGGFIYGEGGNGKTYTLAHIANIFNQEGKSIYYDLANLISNDIKNFDVKDQVLRDIQNADIFIIEDFGGEQLTSFIVFNVWLPILKNRLDNKKTTYISSNYDLNQLADMIAKATDKVTATILLDRIKLLGVSNFKDKNYRMGGE